MIKYHLTGEYRPPKKGEYYDIHKDAKQPLCAHYGFKNSHYYIFRREELPDRTEGGP